MLFSSLRTASFRNLCDEEFNTYAKDIFLVGENGQGKTNFLEALYFCAYASSFRSNVKELARNGEKDFSASVKISQSLNDEITVKYEKGKKNIFINGKITEDRSELLSIAPCIVFCHEDMDFISGSPDRQRWFFDQTLSLYDPVYLDDLRKYRRVLKSRNITLRCFSKRHNSAGKELAYNIDRILDALDPQLALYGKKLMEKRDKALIKFSKVFEPLYREVSGIKGITLHYIRSWKDESAIEEKLADKRSSDIAAGLSLSGPHRDRYEFVCDEIEFAEKASTGQRRLLALLLRTAQSSLYSEMTGLAPVLLLDDVLLEMDGEKRRRFLAVLPAYDQAFYTFLPDEPYHRYCKDNTLIYNVKAGQLTKWNF